MPLKTNRNHEFIFISCKKLTFVNVFLLDNKLYLQFFSLCVLALFKFRT